MAEANQKVPQATTPAQAQVMSRAVMVLARQKPIKLAKRQFQAQGLKPQYMARREIVAAAEGYLVKHRSELIAEATQTVARWHAQGMFGPRGGIRNPVRRVV